MQAAGRSELESQFKFWRWIQLCAKMKLRVVMEFSGFNRPERSGTTLTSAYLSNHPEVYVINDPHYLNFFAGLLIQYCQEKKSDEIIRSINSSSLLKMQANIKYGVKKCS